MSLPTDRNFQLPVRKRIRWWLWPLAAVLHAPIVFIVVRNAAPLAHIEPTLHAIALAEDGRAVTMRYQPGKRAVSTGRRSAAPPASSHDVTLPAPSPVNTSAPAVSRNVALLAPVVMPVDTPPHGVRGSVAPRYGNGRLWLQPLTQTPREIASALTGKSPAQLADSAVTAMVQAYLDQMAKERPENTEALPSWTTKIAGKTVGIDQRWIYLGPLKVPTALLALLPIKVGANPTQAEFNAKLQAMREDLLDAGRRAQNYEDFKNAVKDLRQQKEREREFKKNQRTPPDSGRHG